MDIVAKTNMVEAELDGFVNRRDKERRRTEGERPLAEALWAESERRHAASRQQALAWAWLRWHQRMLNSHIKTSNLITSHHAAEIEKYERLLNIDYEGGDAA